jgi:hypothetical protein
VIGVVSDSEQEQEDVPPEREWKPPERSDQRPGEEVVQVNDAYTGGGPAPEEEPSREDEQHPHGG